MLAKSTNVDLPRLGLLELESPLFDYRHHPLRELLQSLAVTLLPRHPSRYSGVRDEGYSCSHQHIGTRMDPVMPETSKTQIFYDTSRTAHPSSLRISPSIEATIRRICEIVLYRELRSPRLGVYLT